MIQEIKIGDKVEVIDAYGNSKIKKGMRLVVSDVGLPYSRDSLLRFEGSDIELYAFKVKKVNDNRHKHADLIIALANDTSLEIEYNNGLGWFTTVAIPQWLSCTQYRIKPSKTPAELEKESILASIKELEESNAKALSELHSKLKELEV